MRVLKIKERAAEKWFVLKVRSSTEKKVYEQLCLKGFNVFLPLVETIRQWSDRKKKIEVVLISSVVFVRCMKVSLYEITKNDNIFGFLTYLNEAAVVKDFEIDNLRILIKGYNGSDIELSSESFEPGESVQVVKGPFKGLVAAAIRHNGKHRVVVNIEFLSKEFVVNIPRSYVKEIKNK
jgi:transcription antitermination factor NusG